MLPWVRIEKEIQREKERKVKMDLKIEKKDIETERGMQEKKGRDKKKRKTNLYVAQDSIQMHIC